MKVGIHAAGKDIDRLIEYCGRIGVDQVCLSCSSIAGYDEDGYLNLNKLRDVKDRLQDAGIGVPTMIIGKVSQEALLGRPKAEGEIDNLCRTIECLGEASVKSVLFYVDLDRPENRVEEAWCWKRIAKFYERIIEQAEKAQVGIANHAFYHPWKMVRSVETLMKLLEEVPSPYNGVTYCPGLYQSGDNVYEAITLFGKKILFAHARDLRRRSLSSHQFDEVFLGEGDIDIPKVVKLLKAIGYEGIICPEHLGPQRFDGEDLQALAVGYLKNLLSFK